MRLLMLGLAFILGLCLLPAKAHEITPAIADVSFAPGTYAVAIRLNLEQFVARIPPGDVNTQDSEQAGVYDALRRLPPAELARAFDRFKAEFLAGIDLRFDGTPAPPTGVEVLIPEVGDTDIARESRVTLTGPVPAGAAAMTWAWTPFFGSIVLRAPAEGSAEPFTAYLTEGAESPPVGVTGAEVQGLFAASLSYLWIGFTHIVPKGMDHMLFVAGLFLLSVKWSPLLWQVTAFTLAHTVSLALGVLGLVVVSPAIVEPLIALSIAFVAIENVLVSGLSPWRPFVVFGFGLLHGLGFAAILGAIGFSAGRFVTGLVSFNIGVEFGQLAVILALWLTLGYSFGRKSWYRSRVTVPLSLAIAAVGLFWFGERTGLI